MLLSVTCPRCQSKYQLDPSMRGKKMRCPNTICRAAFDVRDDNDAPPVAEPGPPIRQVEPPEQPKASIVKPPEPPSDFPDDFPGDNEGTPEPPPAVEAVAWQPEATSALSVASAAPAPARRRWRPAAIVVAILLLLSAGAWIAFQQVRTRAALNEEERFQKAEALYKDQEFAEASAAFQKMQRDFADGPGHQKYRFLAELSDVRQAAIARESPQETVKALERILQFATVYKGDPLLQQRSSDIWETHEFLARELTRLAQAEKTPAYLSFAKRAWSESKQFTAPPSANPAERERELHADWKRADALLASHFERLHIIDTIKKNTQRADAVDVKEAWTLVEKTKRQDDGEIRTLMTELFKAHRDQVRFLPATSSEEMPAITEDALESLFVVPALKIDQPTKITGSPILALARGILYALEPRQGELLWARRVGIDTQRLPLRVPPDAITPELLLVVSSDLRSLSGVIAQSGQTVWQTPLSGVCLGAPVLVDRQVLVPTMTGKIDEIEIAEGKRLGSYDVGDSLTLGAVAQPGSTLAYFPADDFCLYVIDVKVRTCTNVLYTRHAAGSLPGLPSFLGDDKADWLLWNEIRNLDKTLLKPYALPIKAHDELPVKPTVELPTVSTAPWHGGGRLALVSQNGMLFTWGIRQKGTSDPILFPLTPDGFPVDLRKEPGKCEIIHADAENYWVLAHGRLQRIQSLFDPSKGPTLHTRWSTPTPVGNALHATQVRHDSDGRTLLFVTTQAADRPTCLISALDGDTGKIQWQRQLGVVPQSSPRLVANQVVLADPEGVFAVAPSPSKSAKQAGLTGTWLLQEPWSNAPRYLLSTPTEVVALSTQGDDKIRVATVKVNSDAKARVTIAKLPAALQGVPALANGFLMLPLANGILGRVNLDDGALTNGPDWRAVGAEEQARGYVVFLRSGEMISTDGSRGLMRFASTDAKAWEKRAASQLPHRIAAPPQMLDDSDGAKARLIILDASDTITLMDADRLAPQRRWTMPSKVTAGPFVRAGKIGCVLARNRLVWIDPEQSEPLWEYAFPADVVGEPNLIDGALIVGDVAGQFVALDPANGRPFGTPLTLKANVAPTAAPLAFGAGRAFVPLTDGSIVLLPIQKLRD